MAEDLKQISVRVADRMVTDLKRGALAKIDIDVIRAALRQELDCPRDGEQFDMLEIMTTRRVVEKSM